MKTFNKGTTVEVTTKLDDTNPTSVKITITDPNGTTKVDAQPMTNSEDYEYLYNWQSATDDATGTYTVTIDVIKGGYTSKATSQFALE